MREEASGQLLTTTFRNGLSDGCFLSIHRAVYPENAALLAIRLDPLKNGFEFRWVATRKAFRGGITLA
jgi:hypothetical protein